ncbi:MAG: phosphoribosylanthranilate isomerase [Patescibacteria group bacterium]|jgi:phosphoribosylanthranilate isomerase
MKIKVCGMKAPENIAAVSALGIDYMGFVFYAPSPRYVVDTLSIDSLADENINAVAVFVDEEIDKVQILLEEHNFKHVQLHGKENPDYCQKMKEAGFVVIKAFRVNDDFDFSTLEQYLPVCDYFLFDTKGKTHGGTGKKFNWSILQQYDYNKPFFLSGGIGPEDNAQLLAFKHPQLYALDLNSKFEIGPGEKNVDLLRSFIEKPI